jgi:hypothetical protein
MDLSGIAFFVAVPLAVVAIPAIITLGVVLLTKHEGKFSSLGLHKAYRVLYLVPILSAWSLLNAPSGPISDVSCVVLSISQAKDGQRVTVRMEDGTTTYVITHKKASVGANITCYQQRLRITNGFDFRC